MKTILPEAKRLIKEVDYTAKPIRLLGLTVSNTHSEVPSSADNKVKAAWKQLCLTFE
jgi:DNA polymerase-4